MCSKGRVDGYTTITVVSAFQGLVLGRRTHQSAILMRLADHRGIRLLLLLLRRLSHVVSLRLLFRQLLVAWVSCLISIASAVVRVLRHLRGSVA